MNNEICIMTKNNAAAVAELEKKCFSQPWPFESFVNILSNDHAAYFTLYTDGIFSGYIGMYDLIDEVSVINIAVDPLYRGKGFGRLLMEAAEKFAIQRNCPRITLEVRKSNTTARSLYESVGYTQYSMIKDYYTDPKEDAVLYCKEITC